MVRSHDFLFEMVASASFITSSASFFLLDEAENILKEERDLVTLPGGPVTFEAVEKARQSLK